MRPKLFSGAENWVVADEEAGVLFSLVCLKKRGDPSSCNLPGQKKRKSVRSDASYTQEDLDIVVTELYEKPEPNKEVLVRAVSKVLDLKPEETVTFFDVAFPRNHEWDFGDDFDLDFGVEGMTEEEKMDDWVDRMLGEGIYEGIVEKPFKPGTKQKAKEALLFGWKCMEKMGGKAKKKILRIKDTPEEIERKRQIEEAKAAKKAGKESEGWMAKLRDKAFQKVGEKGVKSAMKSPEMVFTNIGQSGASSSRDGTAESSGELLGKVYEGFASGGEGIAYIVENAL